MRSMLQLVGGVAIAGAVAAGTTAFTAAGIDTTGTSALAGGAGSITIDGAQLDSAVFTSGTTPATYDQISGVVLTLSGTGASLADSSKVSVVITGTGAQGAAPDGVAFDCPSTGPGVWTCSTVTPANDYWTGITSVDIKVAAVAA